LIKHFVYSGLVKILVDNSYDIFVT